MKIIIKILMSSFYIRLSQTKKNNKKGSCEKKRNVMHIVHVSRTITFNS